MPHTFTMSLDDVKAAQKAIARRFVNLPGVGTNILALRIASGIFFGLATAAFASLYARDVSVRPTLSNISWLVITAVVLHFMVKGYWQRCLKREMLSGKGVHLAERTVEVSDDALTLSTPHATTIYSWQAFVAHTEDVKYHYLFTDVDTAVALPKAAIENPEQLEARLRQLALSGQ